jgi:hypothetical protein
MTKTHAPILWLVAAGIWAMAGGSMPAQPAAEPPRSPDEKLLHDLRTDRLAALDHELTAPGQRQVEPVDPAGKGPEDLRARLRRELGAAAVAEDDNPLLQVAQRMRDVEGRMARKDSGPATQGLQQQIVADLNELIRQARRQCQQGKPGGTPSPRASSGGQPKQGPGGTRPSKNPTGPGTRRTANGESRKLDKQQMQTLVQQLWQVALPKQQRDRLMQRPFDEFLPKYELQIEQYYRRLSEEEDHR